MAVPNISVSSFKFLKMLAWTVTSRALVASSAMINEGSVTIAVAIRIRWHIPPLSWNG